MWSVFCSVWDPFFRATCGQVGPKFGTKALPKLSQAGSKIEPSWSMVLEATFLKDVGSIFYVLKTHCKIARDTNSIKKRVFFFILGSSMFGCWKAFGWIFRWISKWFGGPSWTKNLPKISPSGHQKQDEILNGFWTALGSIFGGFWKPRKSLQKGIENDGKKLSRT